ncbi:hypothetical protein ACFXKG_05425 [Streptomyces sp. NPDC059255]|uniref:hypothetical protein n=1 Tax=Streptomyces sp. NPDC059255 TaxID=3346793 RepID=UPI00369F0958
MLQIFRGGRAQESGLGVRSVRREARRVVGEMPVTRPFDLDALIAGIGEVRGRTIRLVPIPDRLLGSTSLHLHSTSRFHREKIIFRELGHLWCDDADGIPHEELGHAARDFATELVRQLIGRNQAAGRRRYGTRKEAHAETIADLIHSTAPHHDDAEDGLVRALDQTLTHPRRSSWP